ncbi:MAG: molybdate ABC transporter substrate-binding protein [Bacteroidia bacterium]|nr:molybdate ABC transporter substrate-binding protein [Bacteroidia bacterium]
MLMYQRHSLSPTPASMPTHRLWLCIALLIGCAPRPQAPGLTLAVAANMQPAARVLADTFTARTGIPCDLITGSSGSLAAQIREGAPYDLFLSADLSYPATLHQEGLAAAPPRAYARGRLVMWTTRSSLHPGWELLESDTVRHIALANPRTAPYGAAAMEAIEKAGLRESVAHKLVQGESIAQTSQFILSGAAEVGFTALSVVQSPEMQGKGRWIEVDSATYAPIWQGVVVLKRHPEQAQAFQDFLFSPEARQILESFGYWPSK